MNLQTTAQLSWDYCCAVWKWLQFESDCIYSVKTIATLNFLKAFAMPGQPKTPLQRHSHSSQNQILWWQSRSSSLLIFIQKRQTAEGWGRRGGGSSRSATEITERVKRLWEPLYPFSSHDSDCDSWNANGSRSTATNRTPGACCKIVLEWPPPPKVMSITVCRSKGGKTECVQQQCKMKGWWEAVLSYVWQI